MLIDLEDRTTRSTIQLIRVLEGNKGEKPLFEEYFPDPAKGMNSQIYMKKNVDLMHYTETVKYQREREDGSKTAREKNQITH